MSKVNPHDYYVRTCPTCSSKRLRDVSVRYMGSMSQIEVNLINRTGYICDNCGRYHSSYNSKFRYDRAQMRRDANKLMKFLAVKKKQ